MVGQAGAQSPVGPASFCIFFHVKDSDRNDADMLHHILPTAAPKNELTFPPTI
jgi:hypothetical protein